MSVLSQFLFLDPDKHPYIVVSGKGRPVARFSNLPCAAQSVALKHQRSRGHVVTPEGDVLDKDKCRTIIESRSIVDNFTKRDTKLEAIYGSR
jgi:hypothetical protein